MAENITKALEATFQLPSNGTTIVQHPRAVTLIAGMLVVVSCILGTIGNPITALAIFKDRTLRTSTPSYFVLSLCASDFVFCSVALPSFASRYLNDAWIHGLWACRFFSYMTYTAGFASILNVLALTVNRYVMVVHHTKYHMIYSNRNVVAMVCFIWIFTMGFLALPLLGIFGEIDYNEEQQICKLLIRNGKFPVQVMFVIFDLIPCIAMTWCYVAIFKRVRQSRNNMRAYRRSMQLPSLQNRNPTPMLSKVLNISRDEMQLSKMMLIVFLDVVVCYMPIMVLTALGLETDYPSVEIFTFVLISSTAWTNIIIYAVYSKQYRDAYKRLFCVPRRASTDETPPTPVSPACLKVETHGKDQNLYI